MFSYMSKLATGNQRKRSRCSCIIFRHKNKKKAKQFDFCAISVYLESMELLKWVRSLNFDWNQKTCERAAINGNLEILQYALKEKCPPGEDLVETASANGHFEMVKWLVENDYPIKSASSICVSIIERKNWEMLKWANNRKMMKSQKNMCQNCRNRIVGNVEVCSFTGLPNGFKNWGGSCKIWPFRYRKMGA